MIHPQKHLLNEMNDAHLADLEGARRKINEGLAEAAAKLIDAIHRGNEVHAGDKTNFVAAATAAVGLLDKPLTLEQLAARAEAIFKAASTPAPGEI